jgi:hypothetical protein
MRLTSVAAVFAAMILWFAPAHAQRPDDPAGTWAMRAEGRTAALLILRRDPSAPGGWAADLVRPDHMTMTSSHKVQGMTGPGHPRRLRLLRIDGGTFEFVYADPGPGENGDVELFRPIGSGFAEWSLKDVAIMSPILLARARPSETIAGDFDPRRDYALDEPWPSNPEMTRLFDEDEAARQDVAHIDWKIVGPGDAVRREATRKLLDLGALRSGDDFWRAAYLFQHGDKAEDYLLAHGLAIIAATKGRRDAAWIAAASLDRYLQQIGQKQIYGTQYSTPRGSPTTQEPYDRTIISDAMRVASGVPPQVMQEQQRKEMEAEMRPTASPH